MLPPELLRLILNGSNSWAAIELWKAGDRTLSAKLVNYGVTDVELVDNRPDSTSRWPTCLTCFKLERLSITRLDGPFYPPGALLQELEHLHRGLKTLQLYLPNIESRFKGPTDFGTIWPSLERLDLDSSQKADAPLVYNTPNLALLPRTLTWLGLPRCHLDRWKKGFPPNLQTLRVYPETIDVEGLTLLPESITDIMSGASDYALGALVEDPQILPKLRVFPIISVEYLEAGFSHFVEAVRRTTWPPNMFSLKLYVEPDDIDPFDRLPSTLTYLNILYDFSDGSPLRSTSSLPRGLTYLKVPEIEWKLIDVSAWPSALATLAIRDKANDSEYFHLLPRRLTTLRFAEFATKASFKAPNKEALLGHGLASLQSDLELWTSRKQELLRDDIFATLESANAYISSVEEGRLFGLPLTLTHIKVPALEEFDSCGLIMPPKMTLIESYGLNCAETKLFAALPHTSIHLTMHHPQGSNTPSYALPTDAPLYASSLTWLSLECPPWPPASRLPFSSLPRALRKLELKGVLWNVQVSDLENLPQNLELFTFCGLLNDLWVHHLPRTLKTLITPRTSIAGPAITDLPPNLTCLQSCFSGVLIPHVLNFPRSLSSLTVEPSSSTLQPTSTIELTDKCWKVLTSAFRPFWRIWEAGEVGLRTELYPYLQRFSLNAEAESQLIDPRTTRRITRYL